MNSPINRVAAKRLSSVEIDPGKSNQHEFHGGYLREELGLPEGRTTGELRILYYLDEREAPTSEATTFTLYDARVSKPRPPEYRLYYQSTLLSQRALEGDLLLILRAPGRYDLDAVIIRQGTAAEKEALAALELGEREKLERFVYRFAQPTAPHLAEKVVESLVEPVSREAVGYVVTGHPVYGIAVREGRHPTSEAMARAAAELVEAAHGEEADGDTIFDRLLAAETELYFAIENTNGSKRLRAMAEEGALDLATVIRFAMSIQQSRKSRRGLSLQHHFGHLLRRAGIPYDAQRETEDGETPDFLVPGAAQYHDPSYPASRLRMVACKSTARERWRQILNEAARIRVKYLLTVDPGLSRELLKAMSAAGLRVFMPRKTRDEEYGLEERLAIQDVNTLLTELRAAL